MASINIDLVKAVASAVDSAASDPNIDLSKDAVGAVTEKVLSDPTVQYYTNSEAWYKSPILLTAIGVLVVNIASLIIGRQLSSQELEIVNQLIQSVVTIAGAGGLIFFRWRKKQKATEIANSTK